jgi:hypothetical protein
MGRLGSFATIAIGKDTTKAIVSRMEITFLFMIFLLFGILVL